MNITGRATLDFAQESTTALQDTRIHAIVDLAFCRTAQRLGVEKYDREPVAERLDRDAWILGEVETVLRERGELARK